MRKAFNIVANVCTIVLMSILLIGSAVLLGAIGAADYYGVIALALLLFCIGTILVASFALATKKFGLKIAVIVLVGIIAVLEFMGGGVVYGILALIPIGFEIASLCVKEKVNKANEQEQNRTVDQKIAELKHLKELKAITDEQYDKAVAELVEEVK